MTQTLATPRMFQGKSGPSDVLGPVPIALRHPSRDVPAAHDPVLAVSPSAYNGEPEADALDVEAVETVIRFVVEEFKKGPEETFRQKAKAEKKRAGQL